MPWTHIEANSWNIAAAGFKPVNGLGLRVVASRIFRKWYTLGMNGHLEDKELIHQDGGWWLLGWVGDEPLTWRVSVKPRGTTRLRIQFQQVSL